jgi:hypothetical protein
MVPSAIMQSINANDKNIGILKFKSIGMGDIIKPVRMPVHRAQSGSCLPAIKKLLSGI